MTRPRTAVLEAAPLFAAELSAVVNEARTRAEVLRAGAEAAMHKGRHRLAVTLHRAANEQARIGLQYDRMARRWRELAEAAQ